ncbi:MAG: hypothetical protein ACTSXA_00645 [Candidatus Heimdallarchaeota archaeon]
MKKILISIFILTIFIPGCGTSVSKRFMIAGSTYNGIADVLIKMNEDGAFTPEEQKIILALLERAEVVLIKWGQLALANKNEKSLEIEFRAIQENLLVYLQRTTSRKEITNE